MMGGGLLLTYEYRLNMGTTTSRSAGDSDLLLAAEIHLMMADVGLDFMHADTCRDLCIVHKMNQDSL